LLNESRNKHFPLVSGRYCIREDGKRVVLQPLDEMQQHRLELYVISLNTVVS
jgi:hypothetical protein